MKAKAYEHVFGDDGTVTYKAIGDGKPSAPVKYELARINDQVVAVSYLGAGGYTLTSILELPTGALTSFASNDRSLGVQHGTFELAKKAA